MKQDLKEIATILSAIADGAEWEMRHPTLHNTTWIKPHEPEQLISYLNGNWEIRLKPRTDAHWPALPKRGKMSDTPRTDAVESNANDNCLEVSYVDWMEMLYHARQLERKLAEMRYQRDAALETIRRMKGDADE